VEYKENEDDTPCKKRQGRLEIEHRSGPQGVILVSQGQGMKNKSGQEYQAGPS
jgi:hypothetical protein